jgi:hypothetical protein
MWVGVKGKRFKVKGSGSMANGERPSPVVEPVETKGMRYKVQGTRQKVKGAHQQINKSTNQPISTLAHQHTSTSAHQHTRFRSRFIFATDCYPW